jgi:outer membrane protein assembly factor BamB
VRSNAVRIGDRLYFVSDDRVIHCVSIDGKFQWMKSLTAEPVRGSSGPSIFAFGDRLFVPDSKAFYAIALSGLIETYQSGYVSRDLVHSRHHVFGAANGSLLVFDDPAKPPRQVSTGVTAVHLSAGGDSICVVSGDPVYVLQCLDEDTLRERWRAELPKEIGSYHELQQDAENVYVQAQGRALAFNIRSGKRLWATNEFRSFGPFKIFGRAALTRNDDFELEWRDPSSGEVVAQWGKRVRGDRTLFSNATLVGNSVLMEIGGDQGDGLRLLKLPDVIQRRLRP